MTVDLPATGGTNPDRQWSPNMTDASPLPKLAYSIAESAKATGLSRAYLYIHIKAKTLPIIKVGSRTLILAENLQAWLHSFQN